MTFHFRHHFHPAGHGTFFSGHIGTDADPHRFVWVYDCGSRRKTYIPMLVRNLHAQLGHAEDAIGRIDLLCLSHFDGDHVEGLDTLFARFRVDTLALPYSPLHDRLRAAIAWCEENPDDAGAATAAMIVDPLTTLEQRGHGERIGRVAMIRGSDRGEGDETPSQIEPAPEPEQPGIDVTLSKEPHDRRAEDRTLSLRPPAEAVTAKAPGYGRPNLGLSQRLELYDDSRAWTVADVYEFKFYNKAWPDDRAPKSLASIAEVTAEVREILLGIAPPGAVPKPGWLDELRALYARHFGGSAAEKNIISLCVHGRPLLPQAMTGCSLYRNPRYTALGDPVQLEIPEGRYGVLLTGDSTLDLPGLDALAKHLTAERWQGTGLMQIPHHGSKANWQKGVRARCWHDHSVICAPGTTHHPHSSVLLDVPDAILNDYETAVTFDYHIA